MIDYKKHRERLVLKNNHAHNAARAFDENLAKDARELLDKAEKWDKRADDTPSEEIKHGPSEEDKKKLLEIDKLFNGVNSASYLGFHGGWLISKLKKEWG